MYIDLQQKDASALENKNGLEQKSFNFEIKLLDDDNEQGIIEGYGAVFGNVDCYCDIIEPSAFNNWLLKEKKNKLPMLWQHNIDEPIGYWEEITVDAIGLKVRGRLLINECEKAKEIYAFIKSGVITGLSIGYRTLDAFWDFANEVRLLKDLELIEISPCICPANDIARVTDVKNQNNEGELNIRLAEKGLISVGFSHKQAKAILSKGFKSILDRDDLKEDQRDVEKDVLASMQSLIDVFK